MRTADFDYELPPERIAQHPLACRSDARLLVLRKDTGAIAHGQVKDLPALLRPGDLMVVNDSRVLPARLGARRGSGGRIELLLLRPARSLDFADAVAGDWLALAKPARRLRPGEELTLVAGAMVTGPAPRVRILAHLGEGQVVARFPDVRDGDLGRMLADYGQMPLPPYIHDRLDDPERYQTVYARVEGSVAAPTAGLHFTPALLNGLEAAGVARVSVTLHVGLGTFRPVTADSVDEHHMHSEWCEITPEAADAVARTRARGGRVLAVGTTVVRTLESRADGCGGVRAGSGWTDLFILPGWRFGVVDAMLTNFHLPRSTLLMLVSAFGGREAVLAAYREAVRLDYRFFSFGDAMLILDG